MAIGVWAHWVTIAIGGALGALCRYFIAGRLTILTSSSLPWGILFVNVLGCFLMGLVVCVLENRTNSALVRDFVVVGFLGAMTTFSTLIFDVYTLGSRSYIAAVMWVALSLGAGVCALLVGFYVGQYIANK